MAKLKNTLHLGTIDTDSEGRFVENGRLLDAENFFVRTTSGNGAGVGKNVLGNLKKTNYFIAGTQKTIGTDTNATKEKIYNFVNGSTHDYVLEYDATTNTEVRVLQDVTGGALNFVTGERITNVNVIPGGDGESDLLAFSGDSNPPRIVDIELAKTWGIGGFTSAEISVMKAPPRFGLTVAQKQTTQPTGSNFMENKMLLFGHRYKYKGGYYSKPSAWSEPAFVPSTFDLDFDTFDNNGMVNSANAVDLSFNTGTREVIGIDLLFKETGNDTVYIINKFLKEKELWGDNATETFEFNNSKIYTVLPEDQYYRIDNVPLQAAAQTVIGNRLAYANYVEGRNIDDKVDFTVDFTATDFSQSTAVSTESDNTYALALPNRIHFETFNNTDGNLDYATDSLAFTMAANSSLNLALKISPYDSNPATLYRVYITLNGTVVANMLDVSGEQTLTFNFPTTPSFAVDFKFYVTSQIGVMYDAELTETYTEPGSGDYATISNAEYQEAYQKSTAFALPYDGNTAMDTKTAIELDGFLFTQGKTLIFDFELKSNLNKDLPSINRSFFYTLTADYTDFNDFYANSGFVNELEVVYSDFFLDPDTNLIGGNGTVSASEGFKTSVVSVAGHPVLQIAMPWVYYDVTDPLGTYNLYEFFAIREFNVSLIEEGFFSSMHSNRDYEVAMVYADLEGRETTALICGANTVYIPQANSVTQNKLTVTLNHNPPSWADTYRFAIKQTKGTYEVLYANTFFKDGVYTWIKLEGTNKNKVKEGDTLIVKKDTVGVMTGAVIRTKVLDTRLQEKDFIEDNNDSEGNDIIEQAGYYIKIKQNGFSINYDAAEFLNILDNSKTLISRPFAYMGGENYTFDAPAGAWVPNPGTTPDTITGGLHNKKRLRHTNGLSYFNTTTSTIEDRIIPQGTTVRLRLESAKKNEQRLTSEKEYVANIEYANFEAFFNDIIAPDVPFHTQDPGHDHETLVIKRGFGYAYANDESKLVSIIEDAGGYLFLASEGIWAGNGGTVSGIHDAFLDIRFADSLIILETEPKDLLNAPYFKTPEVYTISGGAHQQTVHNLTKAFNCYCFGNGAESYQIRDAWNEKFVAIDTNPTAVSADEYKQVRRGSDITYSGIYNSNTNTNKLNEFNLFLANFKEDIDKKYGPILKMRGSNTNLMVYQEDRDGFVYYGKNLLSNADGSSNLISTEEVLGEYDDYKGEYGISAHPDSYDFEGFNEYHTDVKRGVVIKKSNNGLFPISEQGMSNYFQTLFRDNTITHINGKYDPHTGFYILNIQYGEDQYETWAYSDKDNGWMGRLTFNPEDMVRMNGKFYSFYQGEIYEHNSEAAPRNTFYNLESPSKFSINFSQEPSVRKLYKNSEMEAEDAWDLTLNTDMDSGYINKADFNKEEGVWRTHVRTSNDIIDTSLLSCQGIGTCTISGNILTFGFDLDSVVSIGDVILNMNKAVVGTITAKTARTLTLSAVANIVNNDYVMCSKPQSAEASHLLGYHLTLSAELTKNTDTSVFCINTEIVKSNP